MHHLVACLIEHLLVRNAQLQDRQPVEYCYGDEVPLVELGLLGQHPRALPGQVGDVEERLCAEDVLLEVRVHQHVDVRLVDGGVGV